MKTATSIPCITWCTMDHTLFGMPSGPRAFFLFGLIWSMAVSTSNSNNSGTSSTSRGWNYECWVLREEMAHCTRRIIWVYTLGHRVHPYICRDKLVRLAKRVLLNLATELQLVIRLASSDCSLQVFSSMLVVFYYPLRIFSTSGMLVLRA